MTEASSWKCVGASGARQAPPERGISVLLVRILVDLV